MRTIYYNYHKLVLAEPSLFKDGTLQRVFKGKLETMCNTPDVDDPGLTTFKVHRSSVSSETNQFLFKRLFHDVNGLEALLDATYNAHCTAMFQICQPVKVK